MTPRLLTPTLSLFSVSLVTGLAIVLAGVPGARGDERASRQGQETPAGNPQTTREAEEAAARSEWVAAVEQHDPGTFDDHAARIAAWKPDRVRALLERIEVVLRSPAGTRLARRGALLHADIARLGRAQADSAPWAARSVRRSPPGSPSPEFVRAVDGGLAGYGSVVGHWQFGRFLLDSIGSEPSREPMVATWLRAAAAHLAGTRAWGDLDLHLLEGGQIVPGDAGIFFFNGVLHEAYASPAAQGVIESAVLPRGNRFLIGSTEQELREAESFLRRALGADPDFLEARLRFGWVLHQLGQHEKAVTELRLVAGTNGDTLLLYYARLFLGSAEEALGNIEAARECYEGAVALYPEAQSARLALAQLMRQSGDRPAALRAILQVLGRRGVGYPRASDPWLDYHAAPGRHAAALFEQAVRACEEAEKR